MKIKEKIKLLPHSPGVYRYYDSEGTVIYVGKAKDLRKRVAQYFVDPGRLNTKTRILVSKIADLQYSVVDSESDALLLENNLIKQYKPHYNILLKDSKTYPWICVTAEPFPRVFLTRRVVRDGSQYFGPYSTVMHARALLDTIHEIWPLRTCRHKIDADTVLRGKIRPCLDFQIGKCSGCCAGKVSADEYGRWIVEISSLLKGGVGNLIKEYEGLMQKAAADLNFEDAQYWKERVERLQQHYSRSIITAARDIDADVFSLIFDGSAVEATASDPVRGSAAHPSQPGGWAPPSNGAEGGTPPGMALPANKNDIMAYFGEGIYITDFCGGNSNPATGDFSYAIQGYRFKDGKIVHPVREMLITGNIVDLWSRLLAAGSDARRCRAKLTPTLAFDAVDFSG